MHKPSPLENRIYAALAGVAFLLALGTSLFIEGRTAEAASEVTEFETMFAQEQQATQFWRGKYVSLTREVDGVAVMSAEARFEQEQR